MKIANLLKTLELVQPALATSASVPVPIFRCLCFSGEQVYAYNDEIGIVADLKLDCKPFAVNGVALIDLLKSISAEDIDLAIDDGDLLIKSGKLNLKLPYMTENDFIFEPPTAKYVSSASFNSEVIEGLELALDTSSKEDTMRALMGVNFNFDDNLTLYSCDGDTITKYTPQCVGIGKGNFTASNPFCDALIKTAKETGTEDITLSFNKEWACAELANWSITIYGRMQEIPEPFDYEGLITKTVGKKQQFAPMPLGLREALTRAEIIAKAESKPTRVKINGGTLGLHTASSLGDVREELNIRGHADIECLVSASLLNRAVAGGDRLVYTAGGTVVAKGTNLLQVVANMGE